uniref:Uncharacterized protein n=1 Tax=Salix viminalis TaxID=40686 RepID=A0A6N2KUG8_SALVM
MQQESLMPLNFDISTRSQMENPQVHVLQNQIGRPNASNPGPDSSLQSQNRGLNTQQNLIAKRLELDLSSEDDDLHRAAKLSEELRKKQKWILILDDLWNSFELHDVGIHSSFKGFKLILTTRSQTVCDQIDCQRKIKVKPLLKGESWTLFKENLGRHMALSNEVEGIAKAVARECAGLPLGIITVARSLRGVDDPYQWRNTLKKLKDSGIGHMKVFKLLRFSYDRLGDSSLQQCLLYCALFPEDHIIQRVGLIGYLIDEGIINVMGRRQDAFDEGHTMLSRLQKVCLLESDKTEDGGKCVKMHDLIRDMAIQIMQEKSQVIVKAGAQLEELPNVEYWTENLTRVSLMRNSFEEIPSSHSPMCPNLSTLFLHDNRNLRSIADSFFKHFHGRLKVLDLSETSIQNLPESISDLVSLTALLLRNCWNIRAVPSLEKLRALKRLDLCSTPLEKMPQGMECLTNLRCLRMNARCKMEFPSGILPKLSHLQVLELGMFSITVKGKEVGSLRNLETLECHFDGLFDFAEYLRSRNGNRSLSICEIVVGTIDEFVWEFRCDDFPSKTVSLGNLNNNADRDFQVKFLDGIQGLYCERIDATSLCDVLSLESGTELEIIQIEECDSMESLFSSSWFCPAPLPSPSYKGIFYSLQEFYCYKCRNMKTLFPLVLLAKLANLERIIVKECAKLEEIIGATGSDEEMREFKLPKLKALYLSDLPELKRICSAKLMCDSLEEIRVDECEKLEEIIGGTRTDEEEGVIGEESREFKLPKLRTLSLSALHELKRICSAKLMCDSLEEIHVDKCEKLEEIIGGTRTDEEGVIGEESREFKLPKLRTLSLSALHELKSICSAKLICDSLEKLELMNCEKLKRIPICLPLLENGQPAVPPSLKVIGAYPEEWWERVVEWEHPNAKEVLRHIVQFYYIC